MRRHEITDRQWEAISPLLPGKTTDCGVTAKDNRLFFNAIVWMMRTGCPWADLPERFGKHNSVCKRFRRWPKKACGNARSRPCKRPIWTGSCSIRPSCGPTSIRPAKKK